MGAGPNYDLSSTTANNRPLEISLPVSPQEREQYLIDPLDNPHIDFEAFENPSTEMIEDYKNVIEDHGVQVQDIL